MRPIIRASSACLLMAAMSAGGCGLEPEDVGSVVAGAVRPDAFSKLQDYYGPKSLQRVADSRARRQERRGADEGSLAREEAVEPAAAPTVVVKAEPLKPPMLPSVTGPKSSVVERRKSEAEAAPVKAPPVIVEPTQPKLLNGTDQKQKAAVEPKSKSEPAATETKPPPVIVEKAKKMPAASAAKEIKPPPVMVEKNEPQPQASEVRPPPVIVETAARKPEASAKDVPAILASRQKPEKTPEQAQPPERSGVTAIRAPTKEASTAIASSNAVKSATKHKERWVPVTPSEAELAAAVQKALPLPLAAATAPVRKQWITPPPSERELPAANANSPLYSLPPTPPTAAAVPAVGSLPTAASPPPRIEQGRVGPQPSDTAPTRLEEVRPLTSPIAIPATVTSPVAVPPPPTTAALPTRETKLPPAGASKPKEPLSFREECLKRAADAAKGVDVEGISLDEKLAIDALCQKVLKRTAAEPGADSGLTR